ncbi:MAG: TIM barrel protein [Bryobacteraceae bacterium]|nr:TIM barrel protein [Bryobacteraceae bacterium]
MTRRTMLATSAGAALAAAQPPARSKLAIATTCYLSYLKPRETLEFLERGIRLGAPGIQSGLTSLEPDYLDRLERRLKETGLFLEVMVGLPGVDMSKFIATVEASKKLGAVAMRAGCLSGRRYETFSSLDEWKKFVSESKAAVARAVTIADKYKMPLALENHKDWTVDEFVAILRSYSSEYFGVCLDTGNNISLLDDPYEVVERLAPWALSTHIKDMGVAPAKDGFLLSEVVLGTGMLDMKRIIDTIQKARPKTKLTLEMITRDPLRVPAMTEKYWATFPDRNGKYLASTFRLVRDNAKTLPVFSHLSKTEQLAAEEENVRRCLASMPA